jgi:hypothetical protein
VRGLISEVLWNFMHLRDLGCGEVGTPKVPKAGVNHGFPKFEDTCQQIMYSGGLTFWKKLGVEVQEWRTPEVSKLHI